MNLGVSDLGLKALDRGSRDSVSMEVTRRVLESLLSGNLRPGERLPPERKLAEALGVGRTVIREALKSLTILGIVEARQGDGNYLRATESGFLPHVIEWGLLLGVKKTRDLVEARRIIETGIARLAAERRDKKVVSDLKAILKKMKKAKTPEAFIEADIAFHLRLAQAAGNETLLQIMESTWSLLQVWISRVVRATANLAQVVEQHEVLFAAIEAGDGDAAARAMENHLASTFERLEDTFDQTRGLLSIT